MFCSYISCGGCFCGNAVDEIWHHATHWDSIEICWTRRTYFCVTSRGQLSFCILTVWLKRMLTKDLVKSLKVLCAHKNPEASPLTLNFLSKNSLVSMACQYYLGWYKMTIYLSLGSKVSFTSSWKSGILLGEPPSSCYFWKFARTSFTSDSSIWATCQ